MTDFRKYDTSAIQPLEREAPHYLAKSQDGSIVVRRCDDKHVLLLAHGQKTVVEMNATDARNFALWILSTERR
jgi:hypothetical protein